MKTGRPANSTTRVDGIAIGGQCHKILLALRPTGRMTTDQAYERWPSPHGALQRLAAAGYINKPPLGAKFKEIEITPAGRALVEIGGALARRNTEIVYCQL